MVKVSFKANVSIVKIEKKNKTNFVYKQNLKTIYTTNY